MKNIILVAILISTQLLSNAQAWKEILKIDNPDLTLDVGFGISVAIDNDFAIVGSPGENLDENGLSPIFSSGAVYIFKKDSFNIWNYHQKIVCDNRQFDAQFGLNIKIHNNIIVVGVPNETQYDTNLNPSIYAGAVYIFKKDTFDVWLQSQRIVSPDSMEFDYFGVETSISNDYLVLGSPFSSVVNFLGDTILKAGKAFLCIKDSNNEWIFTQKITNPNGSTNSGYFSNDLNLSGNNLIVGSFDNTDTNGINHLQNSGAAFIFELDTIGNIIDTQKLQSSDRENYDGFGLQTKIYGNYALVSSESNSKDENGVQSIINAGAAYIFEKQINGKWIEIQKILASDREKDDMLCFSMSMDENKIALSSTFNDKGLNGNSIYKEPGAVYLFSRNTVTNQWIEFQKLTPSDRDSIQGFGYSIEFSNEELIIGAFWNEPLSTNFEDGGAYIFEFDSNYTLSIPKVEFANQLSTYPNPFQSDFIIEMRAIQKNSYEIIVSDLFGRQYNLDSFKNKNSITIDGNELSKGIYFLQILDAEANEIIGYSKIIKE